MTSSNGLSRWPDGRDSLDESAPAGEAISAAVRYWWISIVRGCLALFLGIIALFSGAVEQTLVNFIAIYWVLGGLLTFKWYTASGGGRAAGSAWPPDHSRS